MPARPNFLLFMPETLRADACLGPTAGRAQTPVLDRFATESVVFSQTFCQAPYCSPSRTSMFTGLYPHTNGHRSLLHLLHADEWQFFRELQDAGYRNVAYGKNDLLAQDAIPLSFAEVDLRVKPQGHGRMPLQVKGTKWEHAFYHGLREGDCRDHDWAAVESALQVIDEPHDGPFCIYLPLSFAHPPYVAEEPYFSLHDRAAVSRPIPPVSAGKRKYVGQRCSTFGGANLTEADYREIRALYYGMISRTDMQFGLLLDRLRARGLAENTVVVYFSDHGDYAGDYGLVEKFLAGFEDGLTHVPFVIRAPGWAAREVSALVEMTDLYPTLLALAGLKSRHYHFGRDLAPLARGESTVGRETVFAEGGRHPDEEHFVPPIPPTSPYARMLANMRADLTMLSKAVMARTTRWKYVYCPGDRHELYDLVADPQEVTNLAGRREFAAVEADMKERVCRWLLDTGDVLPLTPDPRGWH